MCWRLSISHSRVSKLKSQRFQIAVCLSVCLSGFGLCGELRSESQRFVLRSLGMLRCEMVSAVAESEKEEHIRALYKELQP